MAAVVILRAVALLAYPVVLVAFRGRTAAPQPFPSAGDHGDRRPVMANLVAFTVFFLLLWPTAGNLKLPLSLGLAITGCLLALAGTAVVIRSRRELGAAWSLVARAMPSAGPVVTGPYRLVRHPIYLGLTILAVGIAVAFASGPALLVVIFGVAPTFVWRARTEEAVLSATFGEAYDAHRRRTKLIIPYLI